MSRRSFESSECKPPSESLCIFLKHFVPGVAMIPFRPFLIGKQSRCPVRAMEELMMERRDGEGFMGNHREQAVSAIQARWTIAGFHDFVFIADCFDVRHQNKFFGAGPPDEFLRI